MHRSRKLYYISFGVLMCASEGTPFESVGRRATSMGIESMDCLQILGLKELIFCPN